jgi:tetratricopeptide (TPR) repeat protein
MPASRRALSKGPSIWEVARQPSLQKYCDLMASAAAKLPLDPEKARADAKAADEALPGRAAPQVLQARAALALGSADDASKAFEKARALDPRSLEDPPTMHDLARVLSKSGKRDEALATYRALVPRIDLLGTTDRRISALLEAAFASMDAGGAKVDDAKAKARPRLDEATAYLREARQRPSTVLSGDVLLALILVLDRAGDREEAEAALADAQRSGARLHSGSLDFLVTQDDKIALQALESEGLDRAAAQKLWEQYLATPSGKGPWAAAARARLDMLKRGGGKSAKPAKAAPAAPKPKAKKAK